MIFYGFCFLILFSKYFWNFNLRGIQGKDYKLSALSIRHFSANMLNNLSSGGLGEIFWIFLIFEFADGENFFWKVVFILSFNEKLMKLIYVGETLDLWLANFFFKRKYLFKFRLFMRFVLYLAIYLLLCVSRQFLDLLSSM